MPVQVPTSDPPSAATFPAQIAGTLCQPSVQGARSKTLQLLLHGGAYNRSYWQFPYEPQTYNYAEHALGRGYSTLAIDRLGYGQSTRPRSEMVTEAATVACVHQVVQAARSGQLGDTFARVVLVGHSMGSIAAIQEAGLYQDVDAIVITGIVHNQGEGMQDTVSSMGPAHAHPQFADSGLDEGYLAIHPGARAELFYVASNTDPRVVAADEATGDTFPSIESAGFLQEVNRVAGMWQAPNVTVPVLVAIGDHDILGHGGQLDCRDEAAVIASERAAYVSAPSLTVRVVPDAGHELNLQRCAPAVFDAIGSWIDEHV